jgi:thioredoxin-like negative regulator of GroEL
MYFDILRTSRAGDAATAVKKAEALLDAHPLHLSALRLLTIMSKNQQLGNDSPIQYAQKAVETDGSNLAHKLILANLYVEEKSATLANKVLDSIELVDAEKSVQYWEVKHYLASTLGSEKDVEKNFENWRRTMPNNLSSVFRYTDYLVSKGEHTEAARLLSTVPNTHPESNAVRSAEFYVLMKAKDFIRAKAVYNQIENLDKTPARHLYSALLSQAEGNKTEALAQLQQFYEQSQSEDSVLMLVQYRRAMKMDFLDILEQHQSKYPEDAKVLNMLAENYIGKDNGKAATYYAKYMVRVKNDPAAMNNYAWVLLQLSDLTQALEIAKKAVGLSPNNLDFKDTLASILIAAKEYDEAIDVLSPVATQSVDLSLKLAEAYILSGKNDVAKRALGNLSKMSMTPEQKKKHEELEKAL